MFDINKLTRTFALFTALGLVTACGGVQTQPDALQQLAGERDPGSSAWIRTEAARTTGGPAAVALRTRTRTALAQAETYYDLATTAWEDKRPGRADSYAATGSRYMAAAQHLALASESRERVTLLAADTAALQVQRSALLDTLQSEEQIIAALVSLQNMFASNERLRTSMAAAEAEARAQQGAMNAIQEARLAQNVAQSMGAARYAPDEFATGEALVLDAVAAYDASNWPSATTIGGSASVAFNEAGEIARPTYEANQASLLRDEAVQQMFARAEELFGVGVQLDARGLAIRLPDLFDGGEIELKDTQRYVLDLAQQFAEEFPERQLAIEGHTDSRGSSADNLSLSAARADVFRGHLLQRGVPGSRLSSVGFGETRPAFDNRDSEGRRQNRRLELVFVVE